MNGGEPARAAVAAYERGEISAEIALTRLLLAFGSGAALLDFLRGQQGAAIALHRLASETPLQRVAALVEAGLAGERAGLAAIRAQFDAAAALAPEAAVALYSLGSSETLARATAELVEKLREWELLGPEKAALDLGCGIGRLEIPLAAEFRAITGIDLSPAMIAEAGRRCRGLANVEFLCVAGGDLGPLAGRTYDLVLAADVFPYLVAAGAAVVERHIADIAQLLLPGGALALFNYSYRGDLARDRADLARLAAANGLAVERNGTRDLSLWDAAAFLLRKP